MKSFREWFNRFSGKMDAVARGVNMTFFIVMTIDVIVEVLMRYVFKKAMVWGEQLADYCMIWLSFMAASMAFRKGAHMGMDLVQKNAPPVISKICKVLANLCIFLFLFVLIIWGFKHALAVRAQKSPVVFQLSMTYMYMALPVGGVFMLIQVVNLLLNGVQNDDTATK